MRKLIEFLSGIVLLFGSLFGVILVRNQQISGYLVIGGGIINYVIIYLIITILAALGIIYLIRSSK